MIGEFLAPQNGLVFLSHLANKEDANTKLLLHFDGANNAVATFDSALNKAITFVGDAKLSTAQAALGVSSMAFDGVGDYLTTPDSADFSFGTGDFTIDCWFRTTDNTVDQTILSKYTDGSNRWLCGYAGGYIFINNLKTGDNWQSYQTWTPANNTWYHLAFVRTGTSIKLFVDGTQIGSTVTTSSGLVAATSVLYIGTSWNGSAGSSMKGFIDELRIVKGVAKWTSNFTRPSTPYDVGTNDYGPNSYHLIQSASLPTDVGGRFQLGKNFAKASTQYLYRVNADVPNLKITGSQTVICWVKPVSTVPSGTAGIIAFRDYDSAGGWALQLNSPNVPYFVKDGLTTNTAVGHLIGIGTGAWVMLVGIYDASAQKLIIWANGTKTVVNASGASTSPATVGFGVGAYPSGAGWKAGGYFDGIIDEIAIFNRALTDAEVIKWYGWSKGRYL